VTNYSVVAKACSLAKVITEACTLADIVSETSRSAPHVVRKMRRASPEVVGVTKDATPEVIRVSGQASQQCENDRSDPSCNLGCAPTAVGLRLPAGINFRRILIVHHGLLFALRTLRAVQGLRPAHASPRRKTRPSRKGVGEVMRTKPWHNGK